MYSGVNEKKNGTPPPHFQDQERGGILNSSKQNKNKKSFFVTSSRNSTSLVCYFDIWTFSGVSVVSHCLFWSFPQIFENEKKKLSAARSSIPIKLKFCKLGVILRSSVLRCLYILYDTWYVLRKAVYKIRQVLYATTSVIP